jgi:hypothetical protein
VLNHGRRLLKPRIRWIALLKLALPTLVALAGQARPALALPSTASRSEPPHQEVSVCLITPRVGGMAAGLPLAVVALSRPSLFSVEPLQEVQILAGKRLLWRRQSSSQVGVIEGPIAWPLAPIRPGQVLSLRLRPLGTGPADFAVIRLQGAPAQRLAQGDALLRSLGSDPIRWRTAVDRAMQQADLPLAAALLFAFEGPSDPELNDLRSSVFQRSCSGDRPDPKP